MHPIVNHPPYFPSIGDRQKEMQIEGYIKRKSFNKEQDLDLAFAVCQQIEFVRVLRFKLIDICKAYLGLQTPNGYTKAYDVAKFYKEKTRDSHSLLELIIELCVRQETPESIAFAGKIYEENAKGLVYSQNRNKFDLARTKINKPVFDAIQIGNANASSNALPLFRKTLLPLTTSISMRPSTNKAQLLLEQKKSLIQRIQALKQELSSLNAAHKEKIASLEKDKVQWVQAERAQRDKNVALQQQNSELSQKITRYQQEYNVHRCPRLHPYGKKRLNAWRTTLLKHGEPVEKFLHLLRASTWTDSPYLYGF